MSNINGIDLLNYLQMLTTKKDSFSVADFYDLVANGPDRIATSVVKWYEKERGVPLSKKTNRKIFRDAHRLIWFMLKDGEAKIPGTEVNSVYLKGYKGPFDNTEEFRRLNSTANGSDVYDSA